MSRSSFTGRAKAAFLLLGVATVSQAATSALLPLDAGVYVVSTTTPCADAPLAGVARFDGLALSGPHESDCTSTVLSRQARTYRISTTCRALGDGSAATPTSQDQTVRVESRTRFAMVDHGTETDYARCPSFK